MKMNAIETLLMNNPIRASIQRHYEAPLLERLGGRTDLEHVLEVGCGRGTGAQIILEHFGAAHVTAFDLDPAMVRRARRRLRRHLPEHVSLSVGDVTEIDAADGAFDAVFDFGIIHHVPDWHRQSARSRECYARTDGSSTRKSPATRCNVGPTAPSCAIPRTTGSHPASSPQPAQPPDSTSRAERSSGSSATSCSGSRHAAEAGVGSG